MSKERELLRRALEALKDAKGEIADWGAYADAYFQNKWDYEGSIKQYDPLIEDIRNYLSTPSDDAEEPVYLARRKGLEDFFTCSKDRYDELSALDLFETKIAYLHPPKPAESEAEPKTWQGLKMHEVASLWSEALDPAYFARAIEQALKEKNTRPAPARKPMTEEEMRKGSGEWAHLHNIFEEGIRYAEKHHEIGGDDE